MVFIKKITFLHVFYFAVMSAFFCSTTSAQSMTECAGLVGYVTLSFSPDSKHLTTGAQGGKGCLEIWKMNEKKPRLLLARTESVNSVSYSPDGEHLYIGKYRGDVSIMDAKNYKVINVLRGYSSKINLALSDNGKYLVTGGMSMIARLTDLETKSVVLKLDSHTTVNAIDISPNGKYLAIGETNGVDLWDIEKGELIKEFFHNDAFSVHFSPDGRQIFAAMACMSECDRNIKIIDLTSLSTKEIYGGAASQITSTPDGKFLVIGKSNGEVVLIDTKTYSVSQVVGNVGAYISSIAISNDGQYLAVGSMKGSMYVWNLKNEELILSHNSMSGRQ